MKFEFDIQLYFLVCIYLVTTDASYDLEDDVSDNYHAYDELSQSAHHRAIRAIESFDDNVTYSCDTNTLPQPSIEYPAILFKDLNYNNCSSSIENTKRLRYNDFFSWARNLPQEEIKEVIYKSMLFLPGTNATFRACCPSGNEWIVTVDDWKSTADMNRSIWNHPVLYGSKGIWYKGWKYWDMTFDVRVDTVTNVSSIPTCTPSCYFGQCGLTGKCECAPGYSGDRCQTRPALDANYPNQSHPLVLFSQPYFQGKVEYGKPEQVLKFAQNSQNARQDLYQSMRVLYDRNVTFMRNDIATLDYANVWSPGNDIENIKEFFKSNTRLAEKTWYNLDQSIKSDFWVKVEGNEACDNCDPAHGCCYTGTCECMDGYTGENCDTPPSVF